ncbi:MAG: DUF1761 domain-containing protein [Candidatus Dormibacteraeota bacterium]|nr:DUF1761 domain-containing protein [Candidatus Dormibacteraeota bacterium]MDQ6900243.1 DUF1761 domain-containing protein [Candidatus Dormibacteraeota bacterium]
MLHLNFLAILVATIAAFVFASAWYIGLARERARWSAAAATQSRPPAWMLPVELLRTGVVALVVAGLASLLHLTAWVGAAQLALAMWIGFPVVLLSGSVIYENVSWQLAAIHAGDWLGKLLIVTIIVSLWR